MRSWRHLTPALVALGLVAAACGPDGDAEVGGSAPERSSTSAPAETSVTPAPTAGEPSSGVIPIAGENTAFSVDTLEAAAGDITIEFDHRDAGVQHNFAVYPSEDELDSPIAATEIETGPTRQQLRLTLEPGEYSFQCDVHPTQMTGTLVVR